MMLIAESGSTKTDWVLVRSDSSQEQFHTMGFNPFFHNEATVEKGIRENDGLYKLATEITHVYFYGAGCSSQDLNAVIERGLGQVFSNASISVNHDLLACALATYDGEPGISCILGTGSNSCYFDGETLSEEVPALGYVLGDEGSGSYFGKKLLTDFMYNKLPDEIKEDLVTETGITKDIVLDNVYSKPNANVYLAGFMKFISKHSETDYVDAMITKGMEHFIQNHVCCYADHKSVKVHFIGSISHYFQEPLKKAANNMGISVGHILQKPIDRLVACHVRRQKEGL